jgi:AcrR family transcriptional regulator
MGVQERRARERLELRQDILDAARDLFTSEGYENVSMRKIAQKIEYSPATIYSHFEDKEDLLDSLCAEAFSRLDARFKAIDQECGDDPLRHLREGLRAYIEFGLENPQHYKLAFLVSPTVASGKPESTRRRAVGLQTFDRLRKAVQSCIDAAVFRPVDVEVTSQVMWAAMHGLTALLISAPRFPWTDRKRLIEGMLDMQTGAYLALPSGWPPSRDGLKPFAG